MQIKLSEENQKDLMKLVQCTRRSPTAEVNLALELYLLNPKHGKGAKIVHNKQPNGL